MKFNQTNNNEGDVNNALRRLRDEVDVMEINNDSTEMHIGQGTKVTIDGQPVAWDMIAVRCKVRQQNRVDVYYCGKRQTFRPNRLLISDGKLYADLVCCYGKVKIGGNDVAVKSLTIHLAQAEPTIITMKVYA